MINNGWHHASWSRLLFLNAKQILIIEPGIMAKNIITVSFFISFYIESYHNIHFEQLMVKEMHSTCLVGLDNEWYHNLFVNATE